VARALNIGVIGEHEVPADVPKVMDNLIETFRILNNDE
jgi:hypothetical protein